MVWLRRLVFLGVVVATSSCASGDVVSGSGTVADVRTVDAEQSNHTLSLRVGGVEVPYGSDEEPVDEVVLATDLGSVECDGGDAPTSATEIVVGGPARVGPTHRRW